MAAGRLPTYQTPDSATDRADHVWVRRPLGWKCVLCGAVTIEEPPVYPTHGSFVPLCYELPLTGVERAICPPKRLRRT